MIDRVNMSWNDWNSQLEKARSDERKKVLDEVGVVDRKGSVRRND